MVDASQYVRRTLVQDLTTYLRMHGDCLLQTPTTTDATSTLMQTPTTTVMITTDHPTTDKDEKGQMVVEKESGLSIAWIMCICGGCVTTFVLLLVYRTTKISHNER